MDGVLVGACSLWPKNYQRGFTLINLLFLNFGYGFLWMIGIPPTYLTQLPEIKKPWCSQFMYLGQFTLIRCDNPSPNLGLVLGIELNLLIGPRWEICHGMLFTSKIKHRISIFPFSPYLCKQPKGLHFFIISQEFFKVA